MDHVIVDALSPQEDEFALLALGVPSVYRAFFDPRRLSELAQWLDPDAWNTVRSGPWIDVLRRFVEEVADGTCGRMVLKSPSHTFRLKGLSAAFPNSTYIWLVRDPVDTYFSNRKMWLAMFNRYALWPWSSSELDNFLLEAVGAAVQCIEYATRTLSPDRLVFVEFARLTRAPTVTIESINARLRLWDTEKCTLPVAEVTANQADYLPESYQGQSLPLNANTVLERLRVVQCAALVSHGL